MCAVIYMYMYMGAYAYGGQGSTLLSSAISVHLFFFEAGSLTGPIVCCLGWNDWITRLYLSLTLTPYTRMRSMHHHDHKFCSCWGSKLSSLCLHGYSKSLLRLGKVLICSQKFVEAILKYRRHCFSFSVPPALHLLHSSKQGWLLILICFPHHLSHHWLYFEISHNVLCWQLSPPWEVPVNHSSFSAQFPRTIHPTNYFLVASIHFIKQKRSTIKLKRISYGVTLSEKMWEFS